jgi:hypothetical protein
MRTIIPLLIVLLIVVSCSSPERKKVASNNDKSFVTVSENIIKVAKTYLASQLNNPEIKAEGNSTIIIRSQGIYYTINSSDIIIGQIDEDSSDDAIVSYTVSPADKPRLKKHLIILNKGEYKVVRDFASDLKVMWIANKIVYGQIPKLPSDAPNYDCKICKEDVKYKLVADSLQIVK